ncbi:ABA4-like family protein [Flavobacteriaceae bacterium]|nr:ABA4-like family protein [Flavobacteriaceae bacterium]
MTPTEVFSIANMIAIPMWVLMLFFSKWKVTRFLIDFKVIPLALAFMYAIYIFQAIQISGMMDFGSLTSVITLFTEENAVLAGWIHYLAFDLIVGMWMLYQNKELKINQLVMAPCLFLTFMLGPIGFLLFMIIKTIKQKQS